MPSRSPILAEVKAQAILIEKLRHKLAGHRAHRFGASSEMVEQLQLALESSEIAAAAMTGRLRLSDVKEEGEPKRRPIPDHVPRMEVELTTGEESCLGCRGTLCRLGEDITEELEYVPGRFIVNRILRQRLACSNFERSVQTGRLPSVCNHFNSERSRPVHSETGAISSDSTFRGDPGQDGTFLGFRDAALSGEGRQPARGARRPCRTQRQGSSPSRKPGAPSLPFAAGVRGQRQRAASRP
ncbi:IS66 family transposase zinc-finger binding domain-containing protein [Rhodobacteraceae bacterium MCCB 386]|nr:IS66 family transposase zinc-finger binding domain-containing protein [Roseitranquillus sediminis]